MRRSKKSGSVGAPTHQDLDQALVGADPNDPLAASLRVAGQAQAVSIRV